MKTSSTIAIVLAASMAASPAIAQQDANQDMAANLPAECATLAPALDQETIDAMESMSERTLALTCMVGVPRDYRAELSARNPASTPQAVDVEEAFGSDVVAQGLEQSAEANQAVTADLQTAIGEDPNISQYLDEQGYAPVDVIGYVITPSYTYLYVAPDWSADTTATGSTGTSGSAGTGGDANADNSGGSDEGSSNGSSN